MSDEVTFHSLLRENPDDAATWLVYADWLETTGEAQRATVVRLHRELAGLTEQVPRLAGARRVLDEANGLPRAWLAKFPARHTIEGECWGARDSDGSVYLVVFGSGGKLLFKQGDEGEEGDPIDEVSGDGSWMQIGDAVTFSIALHDNLKKDFSRQDGVLTDNALSGIGSNADGKIWTWSLAPVAVETFRQDILPSLPDEPKDSSSRATKKSKHVLPRRRWK
jgi:uncharacterized protein (TIGR02996 family)